MQPRITKELALDALLMAVWRRNPQNAVTVHSDQARSDVFSYIEMFYNTRRRHGFNNQLSPVEYEAQYQERLVSV
jgi:transposase InsO family protein